jgi:hypothetical protein
MIPTREGFRQENDSGKRKIPIRERFRQEKVSDMRKIHECG